MIYKKDCIELQCDKFKLKGEIITESDGTILFDENSQKILYNISEQVKKFTIEYLIGILNLLETRFGEAMDGLDAVLIVALPVWNSAG